MTRALIRAAAAVLLALPAIVQGYGSLDPTFGTAGKASFDFTPTQYQGEQGAGIVVQPDGKLLALSSAYSTSSTGARAIVSRHLTDGSLDTSFGTGGKVIVDFGVCAQCSVNSPKLALHSDGSIIVAAVEPATNNLPVIQYINNIAVTRLTSGGVVDATFGMSGVARINPDGNTLLEDLAVQADGRIVIAGSTGSSMPGPSQPSPFPEPPPPPPSPAHWLVTRLTANGLPDATFQDGAASSPALVAPSVAQRIGVQSDGHIVVAGKGPTSLPVVRFNSDGSVANGASFGALQPGFRAVAVDAQDRVWLLYGDNPSIIAKLLTASLASTGLFPPSLPIGINYLSIVPRPGGGAYLAGGNYFSASVQQDLSSGGIVTAITPQGQVDADAFGDAGSVRLDRVSLASIALQADGRIVAAGAYSPPIPPSFFPDSGPIFTLARVDPAQPAFVTTEWLSFPYQSLGTRSIGQAVTVTNLDVVARRVTVSSSPNFEATGCDLAPAARCTVMVYHRPVTTTAVFTFTDHARGTVTVSDDAGRSATVHLYANVEKSLVLHLYRKILRREADSGGWSFWNGEVRRITNKVGSLSGTFTTNATEAWNAMAAAFFGSGEYAARGANDAAYINDLYQTFFDRAADSAGLAFWQDQISQGMPREMLLTAFTFSSEFSGFNATYYGGTPNRAEIDLVMDMYRGFLGRLPDDGGLQNWVQQMQAAQCQGAAAVSAKANEISALFSQSAEYAARGRTNAQYVADVYNAFLRRAGDLNGFGFWKAEIDSGRRSREDVRVAFLGSPEFSSRVQQVIAAGCRQGS